MYDTKARRGHFKMFVDMGVQFKFVCVEKIIVTVMHS